MCYFADGEPGDVEQLTASAYSQTELIVTWFPPDDLGTSDPLLLRYNLFYSSIDIIDEKKSEQIMSVIPQLSGGNVTIKVPNLRKGTKYVVGVVATSTVMPTAEKYPTLNIVVSTYGEGLSVTIVADYIIEIYQGVKECDFVVGSHTVGLHYRSIPVFNPLILSAFLFHWHVRTSLWREI